MSKNLGVGMLPHSPSATARGTSCGTDQYFRDEVVSDNRDWGLLFWVPDWLHAGLSEDLGVFVLSQRHSGKEGVIREFPKSGSQDLVEISLSLVGWVLIQLPSRLSAWADGEAGSTV